jgi:hypothetical protein
MDHLSTRNWARWRLLSRIQYFASLALLVILPLCWTTGAGAADAVGRVTKVVSSAQIGGSPAAVGASVRMNDRLRTGPNSRLQVTFSDNSVLTLGENANVVVDRFVYNPQKSKGEVLLSATQGAFRFAGGKIKQMTNKDIKVQTPNAALAVRGTEFWAGPIDGQYGVLLLNGHVDVSNRAGRVSLTRPGVGTDIPLRAKPRRKASR